jgi:hypothetical protein
MLIIILQHYNITMPSGDNYQGYPYYKIYKQSGRLVKLIMLPDWHEWRTQVNHDMSVDYIGINTRLGDISIITTNDYELK